jgi:hypothetical protein
MWNSGQTHKFLTRLKSIPDLAGRALKAESVDPVDVADFPES